MAFLLVQFLGGLAAGSVLFLVASGLSLIFGVTRIVNFAHGSFTMLGAYLAWSLTQRLGAVGWPGGGAGFGLAVLTAAATVGLVGAVMERLLLRRLYRSPELFSLLATFGVVLVLQDTTLALWGPEDLLGPRVPGFSGLVTILDRPFPVYDLVLIALGPLVLGLLWLLLYRSRWGTQVRAATEDREMMSVLGIDQGRLFSGVVMLGSALAGLGGALEVPREALTLHMGLTTIVEAFVVVVIGGMGSIPGAFLAALLIGELQAFGILLFPKITLVLVFLVMAVVLVVRPHGLLGRAHRTGHPGDGGQMPEPLPAAGRWGRVLGLTLLAALATAPWWTGDYGLIVLTDLAILGLFAASLHFLIGIAGLVSFGHAAYFGLGAYGAALATRHFALPMIPALAAAVLAAALGAALFGWFCVRRSGVYLAMLSLACAEILWSVAMQWTDVTGGDNGILGVWPADWAASRAGFYWLTLALATTTILTLRRLAFAPFGAALRAGRDSERRAASIGIPVRRHQWLGFVVAGTAAGLAGGLQAFAKGSVFPAVLGVTTSVDGLVMVLLGGLGSLAGPLVGAGAFQGLKGEIMRHSDLWQLWLGLIIIGLVLACPRGLTGLRRPGSPPPVPVPPAAAQRPNGFQDVPPWWGPGVTSLVADGPLLQVAALTKSFGGLRAVAGVTFHVRTGRMTALIGPNGAGKSTCFNLLGGQLRADGGSARLDGVELLGRTPQQVWRQGVGRTFQIAAAFSSLSVVENVQLVLLSSRRRLLHLWHPAPRLYRHQALSLLAAVGLAEQADRPCAALTYGDLKRLELAQALAHRPRLLLLDEPTAGMAPDERQALMALVRTLVDRLNLAVLFTEHDMDVVFGHADQVVVLNHGQVVADGTPAAVRASTRVQAIYLGPPP